MSFPEPQMNPLLCSRGSVRNSTGRSRAPAGLISSAHIGHALSHPTKSAATCHISSRKASAHSGSNSFSRTAAVPSVSSLPIPLLFGDSTTPGPIDAPPLIMLSPPALSSSSTCSSVSTTPPPHLPSPVLLSPPSTALSHLSPASTHDVIHTPDSTQPGWAACALSGGGGGCLVKAPVGAEGLLQPFPVPAHNNLHVPDFAGLPGCPPATISTAMYGPDRILSLQ